MKEIPLTKGKVALVDDDFESKIEAAKAYNEAAKRHYGNFAHLNLIVE